MESKIELEGYEEMRRIGDPRIINTAARYALGRAVLAGRAEAAKKNI